MNVGVRIERLAWYVPPRVETAADLAPRLGRSANWILSRTGVAERRVADEAMDILAARVVRQVCPDGPPDLLINASLTPIQLIPDSSVFIQAALGWSGIPSFSIHATCLSFLVALQNAAALLAAGAHRRIVVVSAEQGTVCRDAEHPESAALIGDGAAAVLLVADENSRLLGLRMATFPEFADLAELRGCGTRAHPNSPATVPADNLFRMNGPRIYKAAVHRVYEQVGKLLADVGLRAADIDLLVPHQASGPGVEAMQKLHVPKDRIVDIVGTYGNCIAASLPMALAIASEQGRLRRGDHVLLVGTGAGLGIGAAVLRW